LFDTVACSTFDAELTIVAGASDLWGIVLAMLTWANNAFHPGQQRGAGGGVSNNDLHPLFSIHIISITFEFFLSLQGD
jgi:hypothetical protein